ncbi:DUF805 domain-containing protein [Allosphingosinicella sp.]|jgi:uncharacterized membrane protein YhaH (DUF805 family)|uniref:DUF805 domain-containing protein n=1 Tax=Allosphingosinicella sp. TaxID=2823234 RepID=UPI002EEEECAD
MGYMIMPLKRCFDFSGRSRRREFWMFVLFLLVVAMALMIVDSQLGLGGSATSSYRSDSNGLEASFALTGGVLTWVFLALMAVPLVAAAVRRAHDQDKSGWLVLIPIYNLILMFIEGTRGPNRFGPDPQAPIDRPAGA